MGYLGIILIGYLINYLFVIIYAYLIIIYKLNIDYINGKKQILDERQIILIKNNINPFRAKDFITLLPYGYALQLCSKICASKSKFMENIYDEMSEKNEYLTKLEKEYDVKNTTDK